MLTEDYKLSNEDIQGLSTKDALAAFFANPGYDTNNRPVQTSTSMSRERIEVVESRR